MPIAKGAGAALLSRLGEELVPEADQGLIADRAEVSLVNRATLGIPRIDRRLQLVAHIEQRPVFGREAREYVGYTLPPRSGIDPQLEQHVALDEPRQRLGDGQSGTVDHCRHPGPLMK